MEKINYSNQTTTCNHDVIIFETSDTQGNTVTVEKYKNGLRHCEDGPAIITKEGGQFWLRGVRMSQKDWFLELSREGKWKNV